MEPRAGKTRVDSFRILDDFRKSGFVDFPVHRKVLLMDGNPPCPIAGNAGYPGFPVAE